MRAPWMKTSARGAQLTILVSYGPVSQDETASTRSSLHPPLHSSHALLLLAHGTDIHPCLPNVTHHSHKQSSKKGSLSESRSEKTTQPI